MNGISLEALTKAVVHRQGGGRFLSQRVTSYPQFAILMGDSSWRWAEDYKSNSDRIKS